MPEVYSIFSIVSVVNSILSNNFITLVEKSTYNSIKNVGLLSVYKILYNFLPLTSKNTAALSSLMSKRICNHLFIAGHLYNTCQKSLNNLPTCLLC